MSISSAVIIGGCIFFSFCVLSLASSSSEGARFLKATGGKFTASIRRATTPILKLFHKGSIRELKHLEGEYAHFYNTMLLPLVKKCPPISPWYSSFDVKDRFALNGEENLCRNVIGLNDLFTTMDNQNQVLNKGKIKIQKSKKLVKIDEAKGNIPQHENDNIPQKIHTYILEHNKILMKHCSNEWTVSRIQSIDELLKVKLTREEQNEAFKDKFNELRDLENKENAGTSDVVSSRIIAYELIAISNKMAEVFNANKEEQMEMAFQLFAAQLAVYSLRLDTLPTSAPHEKFSIHAIAESWPIGIKLPLTHLGEYMHFYDSMLLPLVEKCRIKNVKDSTFDSKDRFSIKGGEKLCRIVRELSELFTKLDKQKQMSKEEKEQPKMFPEKHGNDKNIPQQIHDYIHNHNVNGLMNDCSRNGFLGTTVAEIINKISKIKPTRGNLNAAFKDKFGQLIGELEKVENAGETVLNDSRKIAYELLEIGNRMGEVFNTSEEEKMKLSFQIFAAQLAVYSLRLDSLPTSAPHEKIAIHAIAQSWPIGMKMETEKSAGGEPSRIA